MTVSRPVVQRLADGTVIGGWWVFARPIGMPIADVSYFRGVPVTVGDFSFSDPGGPADISLVFPQVSVFENLGQGDLYWLRAKVSFDVIWADPLPAAYPFGRWSGGPSARVWKPSFAWEGRITGFSFGDNGVGLTLTGTGAMKQLDDYFAKPESLTRPIPYEWAISRQFIAPDRPALRLSPLQIIWPDWWTKVYTPPPKKTQYEYIPNGVRRGDKWTGMLTRDTGSWDPVFSSYMAKMLTAMYTQSGRWTLELSRGRVPQLLHRSIRTTADVATVVIDPVDEGHNLSGLSVDWTQSIDMVYGQGTSLAGVAYSGQQVTSDGARTYYTPLAARRQVYPADDNDWLNLADSPREVLLQLLPGLDEYQAAQVAQSHLQRFGDPGITGQIILSSDVYLNDEAKTPLPHHLVRAGMALVVPGLFGRPEGICFHITDSKANLVDRKTYLTVDSKFRDSLTVNEVRLRGRDALQVPRMLVAGSYTPPLPDQLLPWDYAAGSGMIPFRRDTVDFFDSMPAAMPFPWTDWTTTHPPHKARWRKAYIRIGPAQDNADHNWAGDPRLHGGRYGIPVKLSQAGQIRLIQFAAYDADGNVMDVPFHISFYYAQGTNVNAMPEIPVRQDDPTHADYYPHDPPAPYLVGQHYPFVIDAFETYNSDGTTKKTELRTNVATARPWAIFGTNFVKAGYFPGDGTGSPTGELVDETVRPFDFTNLGDNYFDPTAVKGNMSNKLAGMLYAMIYCDAQGTDPVFFLGRMFRSEPGTNVGV